MNVESENRNVSLINYFFLAFLFIGLIAPWDSLYKAVFYVLLTPLLFWKLYRSPGQITGQDGIIHLSLILVAYVACSSFIVSDASFSEHLRHFRWAIETLLLIFAMQIVTPYWLERPAFYGRLFLAAVLTASSITLLIYIANGQYPERLEGYGFLDHSIVAPAVLAVLWAMGFTLLNAAHSLKRQDHTLILISLIVMGILCLLTMSRGPIISLLVYLVFIGSVFILILNKNQRVTVLLGIAVFSLLLWPITQLAELGSITDRMIGRGVSHRLDIWVATIKNPPASIIFGEGYATLFQDTPAGQAVMRQTGFEFWHPHNLLLSTYYFSGLVGAFLFLSLLILLFRRIITTQTSFREKALLLGLLILVISLNMTRGHLIIASPDPVWVLFWIPVLFLTVYSRHRSASVRYRRHSNGVP